jgi:hypothetical protein
VLSTIKTTGIVTKNTQSEINRAAELKMKNLCLHFEWSHCDAKSKKRINKAR